MGGAAEAILEELLAANQQQVVLLRSIAGKAAGGGGGGAAETEKSFKTLSKGVDQFGSALRGASSVLSGAFSAALSVASFGLGALTKTGAALIQNQMALSEGAIKGTNSLHSMTEGLSNLPFGLGLVAQAMTYTTKKLEANLETYQKISDVGATLGGNLDQVRSSAKGMYLSLDEFVNVMKANRSQLLNFGGTADEGAKNLIRFNSTMIKGEVGRGLLGMGYSLEQANNMLGSYSEIMGGVSAKQVKDQRGMEQSVKGFAEELALSAALEGKSREEKENELKERAKISARENMLSQMNEQQKQSFLQAENRAAKVGGKGAQDALLSAMLGLPPMTKEAQSFTAIQSKANKEIVGMTGAIKSTTMTEKQRSDSINQAYGKAADAAVQTSKAYGKTGVALSLMSGEHAETFQQGQRLEADARNQGLTSAKDHVGRVEKIQAELEKAEKSNAGAVAQAAGRAKFAGDLMDLLAKALTPLFPVINWLINAFTKFAPMVANFASDVVNKIIIPVFKDLFGGISLDDITKPFKDFFKGLFGSDGALDFDGVRKGLTNFFKPIVNFIGNVFKGIDLEAVGAKVRETFGRVFDALGSIADSLGAAFSGGDGEGLGTFLGETFNTFMDIIGGIAEVVAGVVSLFVKSDLFQTLKEYFGKIVHIVSGIVDVIVAIVKSPFGTWLANALFATIDLFMVPFKLLIDVIDASVDFVMGIVKLFQGDFKGGMDKIGNSISTLIKGIVDFFLRIPKYVVELFGGSWTKVGDAIHGFIDKMIGAVKDFISGVINFFSSDDKKAEAKKPAEQAAAPAVTQATNKAVATAQATPKTATPAAPQPAAHKVEQDKAAEASTAKTNADLAKAKDPMEILRIEMQALNKQTLDMIKYLREVSGYTQQNVAATKALNKNLYPT